MVKALESDPGPAILIRVPIDTLTDAFLPMLAFIEPHFNQLYSSWMTHVRDLFSCSTPSHYVLA